MKCSWSHIDLGWRCGDIGSMCKEAIEIAALLDTKVSFKFNSVKVNVAGRSDWEEVTEQALDAVRSGTTSVYGRGF